MHVVIRRKSSWQSMAIFHRGQRAPAPLTNLPRAPVMPATRLSLGIPRSSLVFRRG
jgi:hypothetical protein